MTTDNKSTNSKQVTEIDGVVAEALPNTMFRVDVDESPNHSLGGKTILCTLSGKMRMYRIKVMPGDKVKCEVSIYDTSKGRIVFRLK